MMNKPLADRTVAQTSRTFPACVVGHAGSRVMVRYAADNRTLECHILDAGAGELRLLIGDEVLVCLCDTTDGEWAVVIGRIGTSPTRKPRSSDDDAPDELLLEAKQSLTLRVGDGSITIRADGKILIKGKDLVSHAQRTNRIKGGSVAIN